MSAGIPLSRGLVAIVDDEDFEWLSQWKWSASKQGRDRWRAMRVLWNGGNQKAILMHRLLLGATAEQTVDHINGNPLDNRRANLRLCSQRKQCLNRRGNLQRKTSRFKGVGWQSGISRWRVDFRERFVGTFLDEVEAARAYDAAAFAFDPEYAWLNFPEERGLPCRA